MSETKWVFINSPSRKTETRSHISKISSKRCEIYIMEIPRLFNFFMTSNKTSDSFVVKGAVGSSRISTSQFVETALLISINCCWATPIWLTNASGLISISISLNNCLVSLIIFLWFTIPAFTGSLPRKMFSATLR